MNWVKQFILTKMFSAEFTTIHKYNLKTKERVSTVSVMPYDYTSLYDKQYLPNLPENVYDILKSYCQYKFAHIAHPLHDDAKIVKIEHTDGQIIKYEIVNPFPYFYISRNETYWNHFVEGVKCPELKICKDNIDRMTDVTDDGVTFLTSMEYNVDGEFKYVNVYDSSYNLTGYDDYEVMHRMNDYCKSYLSNSLLNPVGLIGFSSDDIEMKFTIKLNYNDGMYRYGKLSPLPTSIELGSKELQREEQISQLVAYGLIDPEDLDFMDSIFSEESMCDFEFVMNGDGTIKDVYLYNYFVYEFKNLVGA